MPRVQLDCWRGQRPDLFSIVAGFTVTLLYFYPGTDASPENGAEAPLVDAAQHLAFERQLDELAIRNSSAIGVSSQSTHNQQTSTDAFELRHLLLSDPALLLASKLGLPTFAYKGRHWYRRITLVLSMGTIVGSFYPIQRGSSSAEEVLRWLQSVGLWCAPE